MFPLHKHGEEEASLHSNSSDDPAANLFDAEEMSQRAIAMKLLM
jgi:hypothetical protein